MFQSSIAIYVLTGTEQSNYNEFEHDTFFESFFIPHYVRDKKMTQKRLERHKKEKYHAQIHYSIDCTSQQVHMYFCFRRKHLISYLNSSNYDLYCTISYVCLIEI